MSDVTKSEDAAPAPAPEVKGEPMTPSPSETKEEAPPPMEPTALELGRAAADEQNSDPGMEIGECPKCGNPRRKFLIVDGECDSCRTKGERAQVVPVLGWPEVRQRRLNILHTTDWTQMADQEPEVQKQYAPIRARLRDVTKLDDVFAAWYELDAIEAELAK